MNREEYWAEKERVREEAEKKDKFANMPFPNRSDRRRKQRVVRVDESPMTKPSIDKRVYDRKKREKSK